MAHYTPGGNWMPSFPGQVCQQCSAVFTAHSKAQRFCGNECKFASKRKTVHCGFCGTAFEAKRSSPIETCSKACGYALMRKRTMERRADDPALQRECVICGAGFTVKDVSQLGRTCSKPCHAAHMAATRRGTKASEETKAKMSASISASWADPEISERRLMAQRAAVAEWHSKPKNAKAFAARQSARMTRLHTEPEFQQRRDERSSRVMKENWEKHRDYFVEQSAIRFQQMWEDKVGLFSDTANAKRSERSKWVLKQAQAALHAETDIDEKMSELQYRLRLEMPYDGPQDSSDYIDYCQKLCRAITTHPEYRAIADPFMSEAFRRFSEEWRERDSGRLPQGENAEGG